MALAPSPHPFAPLAIAGYAEISPFFEECNRASFERHGIECPPEIARAVPRRRREFLHGRLCARAAIAAATGRLGANVPIGQNRSPVFPAPLRGSITHTENFAAAACVTDAQGSIGIDAERMMEADVARQIAPLVALERELVAARSVGPDLSHRVTAIYSAKESLFKALSPFLTRIAEFRESEWLDFDLATGRFTLGLSAQFEGGWARRRVDGQLAFRNGAILTAVLVHPKCRQCNYSTPTSRGRRPVPLTT